MLEGDAPIVISLGQLLKRRTARTSTTCPTPPWARASTPARPAPSRNACCSRARPPRRPGRMPLGYRTAHFGHDAVRGRRPRLRLRGRPRGPGLPRGRPRQGRLPRRGPRGPPDPPRQARPLPHLARGAHAQAADRCDRTLDRAAAHGVEHYHRVQHDWFARWESTDVVLDQDAPDAVSVQQAVPVRPLLPGPGQRPRRPAGRAGQGRHRVRLRGSLLLGHRGLRGPVPDLHPARPRPEHVALPGPDAAGGQGPGRESPRPGRCSPGARSTARRPRPTTPPAPPRCTSTPTWPTPCPSTSTRPATSASWCATASTSWWKRPVLADLGFWRSNGSDTFHIHGVTGPDEYTTVVNNNLFTDVIARYNLERAACAVNLVRGTDLAAYKQNAATASGSTRRRPRSGGAAPRA